MPPGSGFPDDFLWGVATSAYQIEGSPLAEGASPSIWHRFSHTPGTTHAGDTGDVACDHYRRYREDVALMRDLGIQGYRFSLAWGRLLEGGRGPANPRGLDFYSRLIDALLAQGIRPMVTLCHWDLPAALDDLGGWTRRDSIDWFADYADVAFRAKALPGRNPCLEASPRRRGGFTRWPLRDARLSGQLARRRNQCEAPAHALHLPRSSFRHELAFYRVHALAQRAGKAFGAVGQRFEPHAARRAVGAFRGACQVLCQRAAALKFVQGLENPTARASIGGEVDHAQLLPGPRLLVRLAHMFGEADLAGTQKQQAPGQARPRAAGPIGAHFSRAVRQQICRIARHLRIKLRQLVKA